MTIVAKGSDMLPVHIGSACRRSGYAAPIRVLTPAEAGRLLDAVTASEAALGVRLGRRGDPHLHLEFPWAQAMIRHPRILDAVEQAIGPDIICWGGQLFAKDPGEQSFVSWHQDGTYWGEIAHQAITAWVALTPSTRANGCMRIASCVPGAILPHRETETPGNLLSRGQHAVIDLAEAGIVDIELAPGQMSLHNSLVLHGSEPNRGTMPRVGFAIRYAPASVMRVREEIGARLVRGAIAG